jgi:hypothetical protein
MFIVGLLLLSLSMEAAQDGWRPPSEMLYTAAEKHTSVLRPLGLTRGSFTLVFVRPGCGECEREMARIQDSPRTIIFVDGPAVWVKKFNLRRARVVESTDAQRSQMGILMLPTIVRVEDGRVTGVRSTAPRID